MAKIELVDNWGVSDGATQRRGTVKVGAGQKLCGIALGPGSQEGRVIVNGTYPLAGGRVLPLETADGYSVSSRYQRDIPSVPSTVATRAEFILFTCASELGARVDRPPHTYYASLAGPLVIGTGLLRVPFSNRRHAQFTFPTLTANITRVVVTGLDGLQSITLYDDSTVRTAPFGIHIGGTDHEEMFEELTVDVVCAGNVTCIGVVKGEL